MVYFKGAEFWHRTGWDPLTDLSSLRQPLAVMVRDRWLRREQLDAMLAVLR